MSKFIYPETVTLEVRPAKKKGLLRVYYREAFPQHPELVKQTVRVMREIAHALPRGLRIKSGKTWLVLHGTVTRETIGDMMVGEFMPWSSLGSVPLRRLFESALGGAIVSHRAEGLQRQPGLPVDEPAKLDETPGERSNGHTPGLDLPGHVG